jgi:hypothetical protein
MAYEKRKKIQPAHQNLQDMPAPFCVAKKMGESLG